MRLSIQGNKDNPRVYILQSKSKHVEGVKGRKSTTVVVESLGTFEQIRAEHNTDDPKAWAEAHLRELNAAGRMHTAVLKYKEGDLCDSVGVEAGYLFIQKLFYELRLDKMCEQIKGRRRIRYDIEGWMKSAIYTRLLFPCSCLSTWENRNRWIEPLEYEYHQGMRAMDVVQEDVDLLSAHLFKASDAIHPRQVGILYYDCTNYWFEIEHPDESDDGLRAYGKGKQRSDLPLVGMGLTVDEEQLPLMALAFRGSNEQPTYDKAVEMLKKMGLSKFTFCTDGGLSSIANRAHTSGDGVTYLTVLSLKKMEASDPAQMAWCLDPTGWRVKGAAPAEGAAPVTTDLRTLPAWDADRWITSGTRQDVGDVVYIKEKRYRRIIVEKWHTWTSAKDGKKHEAHSCSMDTVPAGPEILDRENTKVTKEWKTANGNGTWKTITYEFTETVVVTFSQKSRLRQADTRIQKRKRAEGLIASGKAGDSKSYGCAEYIKEIHSIGNTGEVADMTEYILNEDAVSRDATFEGFYVVATCDRSFSAEDAVLHNGRRWMDEDEFRFSKTDIKLRPFFVRKGERIEAHMILFLVASLLFGMLMLRVNEDEKETGRHFTREEVLGALRRMTLSYSPSAGVYIPAITNDDVTRRIYKAFGINLEKLFFTKKEMDAILKKSRSRK